MKKEKMPTTIKQLIIRRIIFLIIFLIVMAGITIYLIISDPFKTSKVKEKLDNGTSSKLKEESNNKFDEKTKKRKIVSLIDYDNDTFDYNKLKVTTIEEKYYDLDIEYMQIDGLLDSSIEKKINNQLEKDVKDVVKKAKEEGYIKGNFSVFANLYSNFANTISIEYYISSNIYDNNIREQTYNWSENISENYDLNTGNKIQIQDIFTKETLGADIFDDIFYKEYIKLYTEQEFDDEEGQSYIVDYKDIEESILNLILDFNNGKDIPFYFDEQKIVLVENYARIFYEDHLNFVAVYNNFKSEKNLFTDEYPALTNVPVLTKRYPSYYQIIEQSDNYYIDFNINIEDEIGLDDAELFKNLLEGAKIKAMEEIEKIKEEAKDSNKFIVYNIAYSIRENYEWNKYLNKSISDGTFYIGITSGKLKTTKSLFNNEIKEKIDNLFRTAVRIEGGDAYLYNNLFFYYLDDDYDWENSWKSDKDMNLYMDRVGNVFETHQEAIESIIWGTGD